MATRESIAVRQNQALEKIRETLRIGEWTRDARMGNVLELEQIASALESSSEFTSLEPLDLAVRGVLNASKEKLMEVFAISEASADKLRRKAQEYMEHAPSAATAEDDIDETLEEGVEVGDVLPEGGVVAAVETVEETAEEDEAPKRGAKGK